jgi:hypothetical protein
MSNARNLSRIITGGFDLPTASLDNISASSIATGTLPIARIADGSITHTKLDSNLVLSGTDAVTVPKGTEAQRGSGVAGKFRYNTDVNKFEGYNGSAWGTVGGGATGGASDEIFIQNGQTVTTSYTVPADKNAMTTGPILINDGVTVTVPTGARWVVI